MNSNDNIRLNSVQIRHLDIDRDVDDITSIYNHYILNTVISFETEPLSIATMKERMIKTSSKYPYLVAVFEGNVVGYAYVHDWNLRQAYAHSVETSIYLKADICRHGVGRMLHAKLEAECLDRQFTTLVAQITANNIQSCRFHESIGYVRAGLLRQIGNKFGQTLDVCIYQRFLK